MDTGNYWRDTFIWIGAIWVTFKLLQLISWLVYLLGKKDLKGLIERYGSGSYAVVTGCTEGIGRSFANKLSDLGFNLVLVSRNKNKLESLEKDIKSRNKSCKVSLVVADFCESLEEGFFEKLKLKMKDLDISLLINNVGIDAIERLDEMSDATARALLQTNLYPSTFLARDLLPLMAKRKRSAVVTVSSTAGLFPLSHFGVYSGTKSFGDMMSRCLEREYNNVDFISLTPGKVSTAMNDYKSPDLIMVSADSMVEASLSDLLRGYSRSAGHPLHKVQIALMGSLTTLFGWLFERVFLPQMRKERKLPPPNLLPTYQQTNRGDTKEK